MNQSSCLVYSVWLTFSHTNQSMERCCWRLTLQVNVHVYVHCLGYVHMWLHDEINYFLVSPEFMFEALSSKNEPLLMWVHTLSTHHVLFLSDSVVPYTVYSALFSCLNSLAGLEDFYSKSHTVYGELMSHKCHKINNYLHDGSQVLTHWLLASLLHWDSRTMMPHNLGKWVNNASRAMPSGHSHPKLYMCIACTQEALDHNI